MKRLLAYLFIVLGLGLTFNVNAHAYVIEVCNFGAGNYLVKKHSSSNSYSKESVFKYANSKNLNCETHFRNDDKDLYKAINKELKKTKYKLKWAGDLKNISRQFTHTIFDQKYKKIAKKFNYTLGKHLPKMQTTKKQTQIAKVEPSQTQKVAKEISNIDNFICLFKGYFQKKTAYYLRHRISIKSHQKCISRGDLYVSIFEKNDKKTYDKLISFMKRDSQNDIPIDGWISKKLYESFLPNEETQIAKAEPSQTQKVAKENLNEIMSIAKKTSRWSYDSAEAELRSYKYHCITKDFKKVRRISGCGFDIDARTFLDIKMVSEVIYDKYGKDPKFFFKKLLPLREEITQNYLNKTQTQIAKAEPSQTQKVAKENKSLVNLAFCHEEFKENFGTTYRRYSNVRLDNCEKNEIQMNWVDFNRNWKIICYNKSDDAVQKFFQPQAADNCNQFNKNIVTIKYDGKSFYYGKGKTLNYVSNPNIVKPRKNLIFKTEPTIIPKKKVKVAKKEPKQEEFKPKKTNQDNEAPVIDIAEAITVDSQAYTLKGKVKDKSQIYLTINGRQVDVKKGKFELDRFSIDPDVAEELKIVAIDQWNNKSEKIVKVTIDLQSTDIAKVYEELKPNNIKVKTDQNKIAIIIGIEKYENLTNLDAKYANRDAKAFRAYATRALGIKPSNIKVLIDDKANRGNTLEAFKIWLPKIAGKGGKDILIFFAGHGLASENGKDLYILPQDGNAKLLDDTAITRLELITLIQKVNPKSVTMFFDTCYSGQTRDERMLVASLLRPIQIISEEQDTPDNFTIFSASNYDQVSGGIEEAQHGMFSYYLMKGLEGNADENKDKKITNGELITYLKDNVSEEAFTQNREQDPMLAGDPDKVLMSYR
ncbi:caspase family protein [Candidatus Pelagibacter sp.]|nr:caspase family protein [Candidatus Pelagibacter sp.]